jgi:HIP---CoA ligase
MDRSAVEEYGTMTETIPQLSREAAERFGAKSALVSPSGDTFSFADLDALADRFALALLNDGMGEGDCVGIWAANSFEWVAAAIGTQRVGGIMIPLYFRFHTAEIVEILARASVRYLVCSADLAAQIRGERAESLSRVVVLDMPRNEAEGREIAWNEFLSSSDAVSDALFREREARVNGDTVSDIMFTSGTTGRPKGAVFTHRSGVAAGRIMQHYNGATEADCFCPMGSFAHVGGYKMGWVTGLCSGATVAWGDAYDPASVLELISGLGITIMPAAPITWMGMLDYPQRDQYDISGFRFAATGGTMIPPELVRRLNRELDVAQVGTGYGMTETCGMDAYTRPEDTAEKVAGTSGTPAPDTELRIVDPEGQDVATGEDGEILIRNPRLLIGYLDEPEGTSAALDADGWFHSGDVGKFDPDGYLMITDRLKDMYIINGLNVYPAEVERTLELLEGVKQVAVIGVTEAVKGEVGAAFIVRSDEPAVTEESVADWCRRNLAGYKVPKYLTFMEDLPRSAMGKVLKNELRASFQAAQNKQNGL